MRKPNFFIIGAPKCGTTSLAAWLSEHPQIYMSPVKEPHFFNMIKPFYSPRSLTRYEKLFVSARKEHLAVGEASTGYLRDQLAVTNILKYTSNARFIVCLRNPVEMAPSLHGQKVFEGHEQVEEFEIAWQLSDQRLKGTMLPGIFNESSHLLAYGTACKLGDQFERLLTRVDSDRVLPVLLDDVKESPRREYQKVLNFLGVDDDGRMNFSAQNTAKERLSPFFRKIVMVVGHLKMRLGIYRGLGILDRIDIKNIRYRQRIPMSPSMRLVLQTYFKSDIKKLSGILDRDLSHWLRS